MTAHSLQLCPPETEISSAVTQHQVSARSFLPILKPDLHLSRAQSGNLSGQALPVCGVWMCLSRKLAHEEAGLIVRESKDTRVSDRPSLPSGHRILPESLHLPFLLPSLAQ
jgi:hypothetical protein